MLLRLAQRAALRIDELLHGVYSYEVWIPSEEAKPIIAAGFAFLKIMGVAVKTAYSRKVLYFKLMPNYHRIHHILFGMQTQALQGRHVLNPLVASTQQDEDYIGRCSRLSRRVSPRLTVQRTLERSLEAIYAEYIELGVLIKDAA